MKGILNKLFGARDKMAQKRGHNDKEMPFLDHLEELRQMLVKIIITLIIVTIGAFVFRAPLMEAIKRPVELAGLGASIELPSDVSKTQWRKVQTLSKTAADLDPAVREVFLRSALSEEEKGLRLYVEALSIFNATLVLDKNARENFVTEAVAEDAELRDTILKLVRKNPDAKVDRQGNLIEMSALRPPEAFMLSLKISLLAGIILAFPLLLYFVAQFVFPGLTMKEKKAVIPAVAVGFGLFLIGASFAYWMVTPRVLEFFHGYADELGVASEWRIGYYVSFVSQLVLIFGLSFELPVVVMTLVKIDLLSYQFMARNRAYAVVIIFTVAAIITPTPDAPTLCLLAVPMVFLYELCIWMAFFIDRKRKRLEAAEEAERALNRQKRAAAREIDVPSSLPTGTIGQGANNPTDDARVKESFDENDALSEPSPTSGDAGHHLEEADESEEHEYEEGFGPKDDEPPDPYSDYDFHSGPYTDDAGEPQEETDDDVPPTSESVDDGPTQHQKEDGDSSSETGEDERDRPSSPPSND